MHLFCTSQRFLLCYLRVCLPRANPAHAPSITDGDAVKVCLLRPAVWSFALALTQPPRDPRVLIDTA